MLRCSFAFLVLTLWCNLEITVFANFNDHAEDTNVQYKYNILAYGDGLTEGHYHHGTKFHPYSIRLQNFFDDHHISAKVHERGESGERVLGGMEGRLQLLLKGQEEHHKIKFDWVIIMAGGDDIRKGSMPLEVYRGLEVMYDMCGQHGARVLALTCLENVMSHDSLPDARAQLNELIRGAPEKHEFVTVLDVEKYLPFPLDPKDQDGLSFWDDGQYLSPKGYDKLAETIFAGLHELLPK